VSKHLISGGIKKCAPGPNVYRYHVKTRVKSRFLAQFSTKRIWRSRQKTCHSTHFRHDLLESNKEIATNRAPHCKGGVTVQSSHQQLLPGTVLQRPALLSRGSSVQRCCRSCIHALAVLCDRLARLGEPCQGVLASGTRPARLGERCKGVRANGTQPARLGERCQGVRANGTRLARLGERCQGVRANGTRPARIGERCQGAGANGTRPARRSEYYLRMFGSCTHVIEKYGKITTE